MPQPTTFPASLAEIIATHRALFGGWKMEAGGDTPPERPDGIEEADWDALGDPGKRALVRERQRATAAEQELAQLRAQPPKPKAPAPKTPEPNGSEQPDLAAMIQAAVQAAVSPITARLDQSDADTQAQRIVDAVKTAAGPLLHDATDALQIDLTSVVDANGQPDQAKIRTALDALAQVKPHLVKAQPFARGGDPALHGGTGGASHEDRVKAALARMQAVSGVKIAAN